jgi:hypothetical protein
MIRIALVSASAIALSAAACSANPAWPDAPPARLSFAAEGTVEGFPGSFRTIDGKTIAGAPRSVELAPGRHTVGYWCPNHIVVDGPPTVVATFEPGREYVLHCQGNEPGRVEQR